MLVKQNLGTQVIALKSKIIVARFGKTYGINGEIIIHSYLTVKKDIINYKNFYVDGKEKIIASFVVKSNKIIQKRLKNTLEE